MRQGQHYLFTYRKCRFIILDGEAIHLAHAEMMSDDGNIVARLYHAAIAYRALADSSARHFAGSAFIASSRVRQAFALRRHFTMPFQR